MIEMWWRWWRENDRNVVAMVEGKQYKCGGGGKMIEMWCWWWRENNRNVVAVVEVKTIEMCVAVVERKQ